MKDDLLKARVSKSQKEGIQRIAAARGEAEAVIIREALDQYIERHDATSVELVTVSHIPYTVKGRDGNRPRLDSYGVVWEPLWRPPASEAPPTIRFDILLIEWVIIGGVTFIIFRATRER